MSARQRVHVDRGVGDRKFYDRRAWGNKADELMACGVIESAVLLGPAGRPIGRPS